MSDRSRFWNWMAARYARQPIADQAAYETKLAKTREYFSPTARVLEFGCGTGSTALLHAPFVAQIDALDFSAGMIAIAEQKRQEAGIDNVRFAESTLEDWPAEPASYDAVLGLSILHLLADKEGALARTFALLKPGGVFVSSTVCLGDWMTWFKLVAPLGHLTGRLPLVKVIKADELIAAHEAAGFAIEHRWQPGRKSALFLIARKPLA